MKDGYTEVGVHVSIFSLNRSPSLSRYFASSGPRFLKGARTVPLPDQVASVVAIRTRMIAGNPCYGNDNQGREVAVLVKSQLTFVGKTYGTVINLALSNAKALIH